MALMLFIGIVWGRGGTTGAIHFNRDVRPTLTDNCFACHGFDASKRRAKLRLDTPEGATELRDGLQAIKGGDPEASERP